MFDLTSWIKDIEAIISNHSLGNPGAYCRYLEEKGLANSLNPYGVADAANILYTIGRFPQKQQEQSKWVESLQSLQNPKTGMFYEATHHEIHTTAHCIAALELFDALPLHPLKNLHSLCNPDGMLTFLEGLKWKQDPWNASHQGAGIYAALLLSGEVDLFWQQTYFDWIKNNTDSLTGFLRKGCIQHSCDEKEIFPHLAGSFHYFFNTEYARQPMVYPDKVIDSCISIYQAKKYPLGHTIGFAEIDWVFCLSRALQQCHHRFQESMDTLLDFTKDFIQYLKSLDPFLDKGMNDLHALFGSICCLAELQRVLPGTIITEKPLKLVLDRRPFI